MSKIFQAGSGVQFESVTFLDLESKSGEGSFFEPKFQAPSREGQTNRAEQSATSPKKGHGQAAKQTPEQTIDKEKVKKEAYIQGKKDGQLEAGQQLHTATQALAEGLEQISRVREALLNKSKEDMLRLVLGVARQVIQTEVGIQENIILKTITRVLESAVESDEYTITVHPEDLKLVQEQEPLFLAGMKGLQNIHFLTDETISRGGCLAKSHAGDVDATIETQLKEIYEHLCTEIL